MSGDLEFLQGVWAVTSLEMDGEKTPDTALSGARIEIAGARFTGTGIGAVYAGTLKLNARSKPHRIDMHFDDGPEAGNVNRGIYELSEDAWKLCIATHGDQRPGAFATQPGSGFALETLRRAPAKSAANSKTAAPIANTSPAAPPTEIEGEWNLVSGVINGIAMEEMLLPWVRRITRGNLTTVLAGPQTMLKAEFTLDLSHSPCGIDYLNLVGTNKGKTQRGIYALDDSLLNICVAAPGAPRAAGFYSSKGDGVTFTVWKKA